MPPTNLAELQAFAAVARLRSFRRAAAELGVSPSALSHALRSLETRVGVRLLNRSTRSVAPTEAGERLLAQLAPALQGIADALDQVNAFRHTPLGTLRINAPRIACEQVLGPLVARFLAAHPGMRVELVADDAFVDIVAGGYDAGVRFGESLQADMVAVPIGSPLRFIVVAAPTYLAARGTPRCPRELTQHACIRIRTPEGGYYRWAFARGSERIEIEVDGPLAVGEMPLMIQAAEAGLGLAYVGTAYAANALATGRLVSILDDWHPTPAGFFLYYPSHRLVPAGLRAFIDFARADAARQASIASA
jgi:DNA-binding transcriptional LysR family regulator